MYKKKASFLDTLPLDDMNDMLLSNYRSRPPKTDKISDWPFMPLFFGQHHVLRLPYPKEIFVQIKWKKNVSSTNLLTYSLEQTPSWEANRFAASQEILAFCRTRKFITAFTSARHLSLSWASSIQSISPHPTSWRSILILSPICACVSPVVSFPQVSPPKPCTQLSPPPYAPHGPPISSTKINRKNPASYTRVNNNNNNSNNNNNNNNNKASVSTVANNLLMFATVCNRDSIKVRSPPVPSVRLYIPYHTSMYSTSIFLKMNPRIRNMYKIYE